MTVLAAVLQRFEWQLCL